MDMSSFLMFKLFGGIFSGHFLEMMLLKRVALCQYIYPRIRKDVGTLIL